MPRSRCEPAGGLVLASLGRGAAQMQLCILGGIFLSSWVIISGSAHYTRSRVCFRASRTFMGLPHHHHRQCANVFIIRKKPAPLAPTRQSPMPMALLPGAPWIWNHTVPSLGA